MDGDQNIQNTNTKIQGDSDEDMSKDDGIQGGADKKSTDDEKDKIIEELQKKVEEYQNGWKRALADYDNMVKRLSEEKKNLEKAAKAAVIGSILPLYNNLCIAFDHLPENLAENEWVRGIEHIKSQFEDILRQMNVERIKTDGQKFDEKYHEAGMQEETVDVEEGTIVREISPGYMMDGEVFIPAKVIVAVAPKSESQSDGKPKKDKTNSED